MARYIDVDALKNDGHPCWHDGRGNIYYEVDHAPIVNVQEVKQGHWKEFDRYVCNSDDKPIAKIGTVYVCSECGREEPNKEPYCHCGADMRGDAE